MINLDSDHNHIARVQNSLLHSISDNLYPLVHSTTNQRIDELMNFRPSLRTLQTCRGGN
jgi:hypothetical protein